MMMVKGMVRK